jgi:hypothetical protein
MLVLFIQVQWHEDRHQHVQIHRIFQAVVVVPDFGCAAEAPLTLVTCVSHVVPLAEFQCLSLGTEYHMHVF